MDTKLKIETALKDAMRAKDNVRKRTLRGVLAAIKLAQVEKGGTTVTLDEPTIAGLIQKEIKSRRESIQDANRANRPDLVADSEAEITVLESFLPAPFSPAELQVLIQAAITEVGASSPADMGKVIKLVMPRVQGRAPGDQISQMVKQILMKA